MSWPTDGRERFVVTSVTGYGNPGGNGSRLGTAYQVLDRAYCHALVRETLIAHVAEDTAWRLNRGERREALGMTR